MVENITPTGQKIAFSTFFYQVIKILYIVLKRQITFSLGRNAAKNTHPIKKRFK